LRITQVRTTPLALAFRKPYHWSGRRDEGATVVLVEVETDEGIAGVGESTAGRPAEGTDAALRGVAPLFEGESPWDLQRLMRRARWLGGFNHVPGAAALALAGLEMALWDVIGKAVGRPVHELLGGAVRDDVDYFGFPQGESADELAADAERLAAAGHGVVYLKVGRGEEADLRNTAAVREAIGARRLRLDANGAWSASEAVHMIGRLAVFSPEWVEQPTPAPGIAALRQVREAVAVPIAADQSVFTAEDVYEVCRQRAADAVVLSPHESGGLLAFGRAAAVAAAAGVAVCLHGQSVSGITDTAQHHLGLTTPNLTDGNQIMHQLLAEDLVAAPDLSLRGGRLGRLDAPGLGVELDRDAVARAAELYRHDERYRHA
jgi:muconate cycloisomerase